MGGGHHQERLTIPDYKSFKVEDAPALVKLQRKLAAHGLKDPWLRNYVWLYHKKHQPSWFDRRYFGGVPKYGFKIGLAAAILTTAAGYYMDDGHGHGHGDEHEEGHSESKGHH